jgi:non-specific serine/threonine protein kinase
MAVAVAVAAGGSASFGAQLQRARQAAGLTQEELAERARLSARAVSDLERGVKRAPRPDTLRRLAAALRLAPAARAALAAAAAAARPAPAPPRGGAGPPGPRHTLPLQLTSFVGRERELAALAALLGGEPHPEGSRPRLVTLTGPGGVGKTRLALRAAGEALDATGAGGGPFPDGAWLVELAPLADPALAPSAVARALGIREAVGRPPVEALGDHLWDKRLLLVVDNCEHLLPGVAPLVAALLGASPGLTVLATSRESLRLAGEHRFEVPPLRLPDPVDPTRPPAPEALSRSEAVALFVARATAVAPDFAVTGEDAPAVAELCRRLDGLPLALELAAARVRVLPPPALLARLDRRLAVLTAGRRDAPARQQTLRATLDWSHALLAPQEQDLFARLAAFAGGCTLEAAETVCGPGLDPPGGVLDGLGSLVAKSLLRQEAGSAGEPRFGMLETVREYALERLEQRGGGDAARQAHAAYFLDLAERAAQASVKGTYGGWTSWLERLEQERDNLRAALRLAAHGAKGGDPEAARRGLRLAVALADFWSSRGPVAEGREWLTVLLAASGYQTDAALRADALVAASDLSAAQGAPPDDLAAARAWCAEALAIYRRKGDPGGIARALFTLGGLAGARDELDAARALLEESLEPARAAGDAHGAGVALLQLAAVARLQGRYAEARALSARGLALWREAGDRWHVADSQCQLGLLACAEGAPSRARAPLREATALRRELLDQHGLAESLDAHAAVAAARAEPQRALRLAGAAGALRDTLGGSPWPGVRRELAAWLRPARRALGAEAAAAAWAEGQAMPLEQAVADALEDPQDDA